MQYRKTSKLLIIFSIFLIAINILMPAAKVYADTLIAEEVSEQFNEEVNCLAQNIYFEAGKESFEGKLAVAQITINRVNSGKFPNSVCGVVKQKDKIHGTLICQFSWFCNQAYAMVRNQYQWEESLIVARKALTEPVAHDTIYKTNALYYHANYVNPGWKLTKVTQIGNHIFYK